MGLHCYTRLFVRVASRQLATVPRCALPCRQPLLYKSNLSVNAPLFLLRSPTLLQATVLSQCQSLEDSEEDESVGPLTTLTPIQLTS